MKPCRALIALGLILLAACAAVPHQKMSDARQAIDAARPVVEAAGEHREGVLEDARSALRKAERHLEAGHYRRAGEYADKARRLAIEAREEASQDEP